MQNIEQSHDLAHALDRVTLTSTNDWLCLLLLLWDEEQTKQEISLKKIFGGSQILTILTQLSDEIPLYSLSLHAGKGCSV